ncbi:MAG: prohibitin family protein [Clostridia bacterium]|nr:prohibitin family protein [Clostridia bacterium]
MLTFITAILFLAGGIIAGIALKKSGSVSKSGKAVKRFAFIPITAGAAMFVALTATCLFAAVPTGHTGVVTVFGKVEDTVLEAGVHVKAPWEEVVKMDNRVQKATVDLQCFSSDIQEVEIKYTLNYQIKKDNAQEIYKTVGISYYDTVITPNVAESVKTITAHYTAENLIGNRDELASQIEELLGEQLDKYNIEVVSTAIEDMDFTDEFTNAVEAKQVAVQNKLKAQTEQEQKTMEAQQAAERARIEATANAEVARIQAEADKIVAEIGADSAEYQGKKEAAITLQRLASLNGWSVVAGDDGINKLYKADGTEVTAEELKEGTKKLVEYYYIEQWNGVLPETFVGDGSASTIILGNNG